jgi:hypothetical protein
MKLSLPPSGNIERKERTPVPQTGGKDGFKDGAPLFASLPTVRNRDYCPLGSSFSNGRPYRDNYPLVPKKGLVRANTRLTVGGL